MCRFQSGGFWKHELLDPYEFYWRVECVLVRFLALRQCR